MSKNRLIYLPLGGAGEIGMNAYVYGYGPKDKERLILVDIGVAFPDMDTTPGVDLIFADVSWLEARKDRLEAVLITHGHEDHVGAVGLAAAKFGVPIYARSFTAHLARHKLLDKGYSEALVKTAPTWPETLNIGPFEVGFAPISHSIPQSSALVIDTDAGRIVHTGDFKIDRTPVVGEPFDDEMWKEIGAKGVKAMVCDSTNVFSKNDGRSEALLVPELEKFAKSRDGMIVATTFASNVARVKSLAEAAVSAGRSVCLLGRAMRRMVDAALETGMIKDFPSTISPEEVMQIPRDNVMLIVTGSQGERRAASAQLANGKYMGITLAEGDTVLYSSKVIPGNERDVYRVMNMFSEKGVDVVDDSDGLYHVSGHANRPDLDTMRELLQPQVVIPMHGEHRHLREHAKHSKSNGVDAVLAVNGMMVDLAGNAPKVVEYVETGRSYLDGSVKIGAFDGIVRERIKMALNGMIVVSQIMDEDGAPLGDPWCDVSGLPELGRSEAPLLDVIEEDLSQFIGRADQRTLDDDDALETAMRRIVRNTAMKEIGKKPEAMVVISRMA